jgi:hypothetical protein
MKIALIGATGMIGQRILAEALRRGHEVTAIVRDPSRVAEAPGVHAVAADVTDPATVARVVAGADAVVNAQGPGHDAPESVITVTRALIAGLRQAGVKRLLVVGGAGSLEVAHGVQLIDTPEFPTAWKGVAQAHRDALEVYRAEAGDLDWSYLSPAALIQPGERTGKFRVGGDQLLTDAEGKSRIAAEDYAIAMLDELENPQHVRKRFTVGY